MWLLLFIALNSPAKMTESAAYRNDCKSDLETVVFDCAEEKSRQACEDAKDVEACSQAKVQSFLKRCDRDVGFAWCHRCRFKPEGCKAKKKQRKPKRHTIRIYH